MPITNNVILANSSGSVGIGTYTPTQKLDVIGNTYVSGRLSVATTSTAGTGITIGGSTVLLSFAEMQQGGIFYFYNSGNTTNTQLSQNGTNFYINATGNVGISTTSPTLAKLQVQGNVWAQSFTGSFSGSAAAPGLNTQVIFNSSGSLAASSGFVFTGANVGIGTTSPPQKLQVVDSTTFTSINVYNNRGSSGGTSSIMLGLNDGAFVTNDAARMEARVVGNPNSALDFKVYGSSLNTIMTLLGTGNVGIGTATPAAKLSVELSGAANQRLANFRNTGGNSFIEIQSSGTGAIGFWTAADNSFSIYQNATAGTIGTSVLYVSSSTNVGIGTTAPGDKLTVYGAANAPLGTRIINATNGTAAYSYLSIGVAGSAINIFSYPSANSTRASTAYINTDSSVTNGLLVTTDAGPIRFSAASTAGGQLYINTSGNVGIGTTSPTAQLEIKKSAQAVPNILLSGPTNYDGSDFKGLAIANYFSDGAANRQMVVYNPDYLSYPYLRFVVANLSYASIDAVSGSSATSKDLYLNGSIYITSGSNVGIGTTNPVEKLDVNGKVKVGTRLALSPSVFGYNSTWKTLILGSTGSNYLTDAVTITFGVDISSNPGGSYTGDGRELIFRNFTSFITPNEANTDYRYLMQFNSGSVYLVPSFGNVGIATTSPTLAKLQVQGNIWAQSFTGSFSGSSAAPGSNTNVIYNSSGVLAGSNNFVFNGTNVGIGTTSPTSRFEINNGSATTSAFYANIGNPSSTITLFEHSGSNTPVTFRLRKTGYSGAALNYGLLYLHMNDNTVGNGSALYFTLNDSLGNEHEYGGIGAVIGANTNGAENGHLYFITSDAGTNRSEKMRILSNGNVGIGTTTPASKLEIYSGSGDNYIYTTNGTAATFNGLMIRYNNTNYMGAIGNPSSGEFRIGGFNVSGYYTTIYSNNSETVRVTAGNVGIGTTAPGAKLEVYNGDIWLNAASAAVNPEIRFIDDSGIGVAGAKIRYGNGDGNLYIEHVYNEVTSGIFFRNKTSGTALNTLSLVNGNVGIGITSPVTTLHVSSSAAEAFRITGGTVNGLYSTFFNGTIAPLFLGFGGTLSATATNNDGVIRYNASYNLIFTSDGTERMRLNANGNLGIGTTTPAYKLEVSGETNSVGGFRYNAVPVIFNSSTDVYANIRVLASYSTFNDGMYINYNSSGSTSAHLRFYANATNERMRIDAASGNVGIATNSPTLAKLQVQGNVWAESFTGSFSGSISAPGSNTQVIYNSGGAFAASSNFIFDGTNVGIGTTSPTQKLSVSTNASAGTGASYPLRLSGGELNTVNDAVGIQFVQRNVSNDYGGYIRLLNTGGSPGFLNPRLEFGVQDTSTNALGNITTKMVITGDGNVGIGTTSPTLAKLQVQGNVWAESFTGSFSGSVSAPGSNTQVVYNSGGAFAASSNFVFNGSSVGIGTTSPTEVLDVYKANNTSWAPRIVARDAAYASFLGVYNGLPGVFAHNSALSAWATLYLNTVDPTSAGNSANVLIGGNVGIGTSSPNAKLQLADGGADWATSGTIGTTLGSMHLSPSNNTANYGNAITFGARDSGPYTSAHAGIYVRSGGSFGTTMAFGTTDSYAAGAKVSMFINESGLVTISRSSLLVTAGSVGIGTTSAAYNLDILATGAGVIRVKGGSTGYTQANILLQSSTTDVPEARGLGIYTFNEGTDATWYFGNPYTYGDYFQINRKSGTTYSVAAADPNDAKNFVSINNVGNVGINILGPTEKVHVSGSIYVPYNVDAGFLGFSYSDNFETAGVRVPQYGMRWGNPSDGSGNVEAFYSGYGGIRMYTAGALKLKIDSGGNIGLGPSTGSVGTLELTATSQGSPVSGRLSFGTDGTGWQFRIAKNQAGTKTDYFTIQDNGNVGIGTTGPTRPLHLYKSSAATEAYIQSDTAQQAALYFKTTGNAIYVPSNSSTEMRFFVNSGDRLTIDASGNVGIGTTIPQTKLQIVNNVSGGGFASYGSYQILLYQAGSAANSYGIGIESNTMMFNSDNYYKFYVDNVAKVYIDNNGTITAAGDLVAYGSPSDITLKTNIKPLQGALEKITKLQGVSFTWKDSEQTKMTGFKDDIGFIAQEVKEILPELVRENDNGLLSLRDKGIVPYLVEAIKEQQKQIDELRYLLKKQ